MMALRDIVVFQACLYFLPAWMRYLDKWSSGAATTVPYPEIYSCIWQETIQSFIKSVRSKNRERLLRDKIRSD